MKKTRKIICALTAFAIALAVAGCGSGDETVKEETAASPRSGGTAEAAAEEEKAPKAAASPDAAAGDTKDAETADVAEGMTTADGYIAEDGEAAYADDRLVNDPGISENDVKAGILTAGEWNDNENWGFFSNLVNSGTIEFPSYGIDPRLRTAVTVKNGAGEPVVNAKVRLLDEDGGAIWNAVTDKNGVAYLFNMSGRAAAGVTAENPETGETASCDVSQSAPAEDGQGNSSTGSETVELTVGESFGGVSFHEKTEIMFIVDTTGSMSDELLFLQSEFSAIAEEIGTDNTKYSVNFYRDEGDDYVTKCTGFTDDIADLKSRLNAESAVGGGDIPEAVADIMKETITEGEWSEDAVKIAFLIFDAPPHDGTEEALEEATRAAAEKGIRLVPVVSSNSERDTELFARALAICTGGTYVFLTDDSGVGDSHLEPIIGDYEVEKLYDVIIRIINGYRQSDLIKPEE